jgi:hypothetical protein
VAYIAAAFPSLAVSGGPLNISTSRTAFCRGDSRQVTFPAWDASPDSPEAVLEAQRAEWVRTGKLFNDWRKLPEFRSCLAALQPRFDAEIGKGVPPPPEAQ